LNKQTKNNLFYGLLFITFTIGIVNFVSLCDQASYYFSIGAKDIALNCGYFAEGAVLLPSLLIVTLLGAKRYCFQ
jgi:hypothetical protein